jgi:hypothetical protein
MDLVEQTHTALHKEFFGLSPRLAETECSPAVKKAVAKLRLPAPKARNVIAWGNAPGKDLSMLEALKARNTQGRPKLAGVAPRLFRAFSAKSVHLISPGPMAQAFTSRAVGAGKKRKRVLTQALNCWAIFSRPLNAD